MRNNVSLPFLIVGCSEEVHKKRDGAGKAQRDFATDVFSQAERGGNDLNGVRNLPI